MNNEINVARLICSILSFIGVFYLNFWVGWNMPEASIAGWWTIPTAILLYLGNGGLLIWVVYEACQGIPKDSND